MRGNFQECPLYSGQNRILGPRRLAVSSDRLGAWQSDVTLIVRISAHPNTCHINWLIRQTLMHCQHGCQSEFGTAQTRMTAADQHS